MSEKPTMETVECWKRVHSRYNDPRTPHFPVETYCVDYERAIRLERERDALREALRDAMMDCDHMILAWPSNPYEWQVGVRKMQDKIRAVLGKGAG